MERLLNQFKNGFKIKNALSNLYLYLEEIKSSEAKNVYRIGIGSIPDSKKSTWKLKQGENGYLYIYHLQPFKVKNCSLQSQKIII